MLMLNVITDGLRTLFAFLSKYIYELIAILYDLFIDISRVKILSSSQIEPIYQRLTIIITIVMVFYVTFQTVKYVVQPEQFSDKEQGAQKIVLKMVLVVVLIAFVPKIFEWANTFQNKIFDTQIISKVIIGHGDTDVSTFGKNISYNVFNTFYGTNSESFTKKELLEESNCEKMSCEQVVNINLSKLQQEGKMPLIFTGLNEQGKIIEPTTGNEVKEYYISFNGLLAVAVGGFIAYILLMYCIDVGVRVIQLAFLQIIAPIPIMGYLSPKKDGMFEKWVKQCLTTYLDVFLRLAIIYFILLICEILGEAIVNNTLVSNVNGFEWAVYIALILGLLLFAKKAPDLLKDILPKSLAASGNFGLKAKERFAPVRGLMKPAGRIAGAATGAVMGAAAGVATGIGQGVRRSKSLNKDGKQKGVGAGIWGATKGAVGGLVGGTARGMYNGGKKGNVFKNSISGAQKQIQANQKFGNREENGYTLGHQIEDRTRGMVGAKSRIEVLEEQKSPIKRHQEMHEKIIKAKSDMESEAESAVKKGKGKYSGELASAEKRLQNIKDNQNFINDTRNNIRNSQLYRQKCSDIDKNPNNAGKSAADIAKMKDDLLENLTNQSVDEQLTKAQKAVKEAKDKAVFDIITNGEYKGVDAAGNDVYEKNVRISSIRTSLSTEMEEYNKYNNNAEYSVNEELVKSAMADGDLFDALIKGKSGIRIPILNEDGSIKKDASGNDMYYTLSDADGINNQVDADKNKLVGIVQHQEAIKRQTSGSGIGDKK